MSLRIIEWPDFLKDSDSESTNRQSEKSAMTVGVFDGLHLGHRVLIDKIVRKGPNPTVVTFRENPKKVMARLKGKTDAYEGDIFSLKQKIAAFDGLGVKQVILIDFSENFSKLRGREFLDLLENRGKMGFLTIGRNFRCGYQQDTDADLIREINELRGIPTEIVQQVELPVEFGSGPVSSSRIRSAITEGNIALAKALMGRNIELDISDITPEFSKGIKPQSVHGVPDSVVYDLSSVQRIVPASGRYAVRIYPGSVSSWVDTDNDGKVFLPGMPALEKAESIEFLPIN